MYYMPHNIFICVVSLSHIFIICCLLDSGKLEMCLK